MNLSLQEYRILAGIINDTFGRSTDETAGAFKVSARILQQDKLEITCLVVVNLLNRSEMQKEASKAVEQLDKACNEYLKGIKKDFKAEAGKTLKVKETGRDMTTELINMSSYSPKGTSLIRCVYKFDLK